MEVTTIGIDSGKERVRGERRRPAGQGGRCAGNCAARRCWSFMSKLRPCVVGLEACGGAHHWARALTRLGHQVRLMSPALVVPYRKGHKHDRNDADAVLEAVSRPSMRFVAVKTIAQQDLLALHRVRARLLKQRIALSNQIRALLHERGVTARLGAAGLRAAVAAALAADHHELSAELRQVIAELMDELRQLELRIKAFDQRLERAAQSDERCRRLREVPGVGPQIATALVATVGDAREFRSGRELSAYLGLTPRQHSSGGKTVMLGHQQARRPLLAHPFDPWRAFAALPQPPRHASARALGGTAERRARTQCGGGGAGQPPRTGAVGLAQPRRSLPPRSPTGQFARAALRHG